MREYVVGIYIISIFITFDGDVVAIVVVVGATAIVNRLFVAVVVIYRYVFSEGMTSA